MIVYVGVSLPNESTPETINPTRTLRSSSKENQHVVNSRTGVLVKKCIRSKKTEALVVCKTESIQVSPFSMKTSFTYIIISFCVQTSILNDAKILQHKELSDRFANVKSNLEFVAKEERYHISCQNEFGNLARAKKTRREKEEQSDWILKTKIREKAFAAGTDFVNDLVLENGEVHKAIALADHHRMLLQNLALNQMIFLPTETMCS